MKKVLILLLSLCFFTAPAYAQSAEVEAILPDAARDLWQEAADETPQTTLQNGVHILLERGKRLLGDTFRDRLRPAALVLATVLLCAVAESVYRGAGNEKVPNFIPLVGVLTITALSSGSVETMMTMGQETVEQLHIFAQALLPTLAAAVSASGGLVSAGVRQVATVWLCGVLISLIRTVLLPLVYGYIAVSAAHCMAPRGHLKAIGETMRKGMTWLLSGSLLLFTGYLSLSGAMAQSADGLTLSLTRSAISTAVPVVGGIISEASSSVLAGAALLKNTIGVGGMLGVLSVCLSPFLALGVQYLLFLLAAFFSDMLGTSLSGYIRALGSSFGLVLGMAGTCALVLLISIASSVSVVIL